MDRKTALGISGGLLIGVAGTALLHWLLTRRSSQSARSGGSTVGKKKRENEKDDDVLDDEDVFSASTIASRGEKDTKKPVRPPLDPRRIFRNGWDEDVVDFGGKGKKSMLRGLWHVMIEGWGIQLVVPVEDDGSFEWFGEKVTPMEPTEAENKFGRVAWNWPGGSKKVSILQGISDSAMYWSMYDFDRDAENPPEMKIIWQKPELLCRPSQGAKAQKANMLGWYTPVFRSAGNQLMCSIPIWTQNYEFFDWSSECVDTELLGPNVDDSLTHRGLTMKAVMEGMTENQNQNPMERYSLKRTEPDVNMILPREQGALVALCGTGGETDAFPRDVAFVSQLARLLTLEPGIGSHAASDPFALAIRCRRHAGMDAARAHFQALECTYFALAEVNVPQGLEIILQNRLSMQSMALTGNIALIVNYFNNDHVGIPNGAVTASEANCLTLAGLDLTPDQVNNWESLDPTDMTWANQPSHLTLRFCNCHGLLDGFVQGCCATGKWRLVRTLLRFLPQDHFWQVAARDFFCVQRLSSRQNLEPTRTNSISTLLATDQPPRCEVFDQDVVKYIGESPLDQWETFTNSVVSSNDASSSSSLGGSSWGKSRSQELREFLNTQRKLQVLRRWQIVKRVRKEEIKLPRIPEFESFVLSLHGKYVGTLGGRVHYTVEEQIFTGNNIAERMAVGAEVRSRFPISAEFSNILMSDEDRPLSEEEKECRSDFSSRKDLMARCVELNPAFPQAWVCLANVMRLHDAVWLDDGTGARKWQKVEVITRYVEGVPEQDPDPWNYLACEMPWADRSATATVRGKAYTKAELAKKALDTALHNLATTGHPMVDPSLYPDLNMAMEGVACIWDSVGQTVPPGEMITIEQFMDYPDEVEEPSKVHNKPRPKTMSGIDCYLMSLKAGRVSLNAPTVWLHLGRSLAEYERAQFAPVARGEKPRRVAAVKFPAARLIHIGDEGFEVAVELQRELREECKSGEKTLEIVAEIGTPANSAKKAKLNSQLMNLIPSELRKEVEEHDGGKKLKKGDDLFITISTYACFRLSVAVDEERLLSSLAGEEEPEAVHELLRNVGKEAFSEHGQRVLETEMNISL